MARTDPTTNWAHNWTQPSLPLKQNAARAWSAAATCSSDTEAEESVETTPIGVVDHKTGLIGVGSQFAKEGGVRQHPEAMEKEIAKLVYDPKRRRR